MFLFTWVLMSLSTHYIGHIPTTNFPIEVGPGFKLQSQMWEARVLPLCHRGPPHILYDFAIKTNIGNIRNRPCSVLCITISSSTERNCTTRSIQYCSNYVNNVFLSMSCIKLLKCLLFKQEKYKT